VTVTAPRTPLPPAPPQWIPRSTSGGLPSGTQQIIDTIRGHHIDLTGVTTLGGETPHVGATPGPTTRGGGPHGNTAGEHHRTDQAIETGPMRGSVCSGDCAGAPPVEISPPLGPSNDGPSLSKRDIDQVVRSAAGRLRACYQKQLDHHDALAGTITLRFVIGGDGKVQTTAVASDTVGDRDVTDCVRRNIQMLSFPARGGAVVTYPFVFAPGS